MTSHLPPHQLSVFQQRLRSKEEALQILKRELDSAHSQEGRLRQEIAQLVREPLTQPLPLSTPAAACPNPAPPSLCCSPVLTQPLPLSTPAAACPNPAPPSPCCSPVLTQPLSLSTPAAACPNPAPPSLYTSCSPVLIQPLSLSTPAAALS